MTQSFNGRVVLAVHPFTRGFAWVAFEGPFTPYDWGITCPRSNKNLRCARRFGEILTRLQPDTLVIETSQRPGVTISPRIKRLCRLFIAQAVERGVAVVEYSHADVKACFAPVGAATRHEIAEAVARHISLFEQLVPPKRRHWDAQHPMLALFSAAALAMTQYQREKLISPEDYLSW